MKHLFTLIFAFSIFTASAQYTASVNKAKNNINICAERGHSITYTKTTTTRPPYTIDTTDSTVTVYPVPNSTTGKCSRCGAEIENFDKDIRVTTWRRKDNASLNKSNNFMDETNWGYNEKRSVNQPFKSSNLNDIKKVATLRNDTLFIHKRIAPFTSIKEQITTTTTILYNNKPLVFKTAVFDEAVFYTGKNGIEIF